MEENVFDTLEKAKNGDPEAFGVIYNMYYTPLFRYFYYRTKDTEVSYDLTQDVFIKAFQSVHLFTQQSTSPLAYFYTIARRTLIDWYRKHKDNFLDEDQQYVDENADTSIGAIENEAQTMLGKALTCLSLEHQDIIKLRYLEELSYKEIALICNKKEEAIRQIISRNLKKMKVFLKKQYPDYEIT